ncbi:MAG: hypothetical protein GXO29_04080 [Thermotogae bacterium]|nr:hypothetical protein [Thermotogota bacterium]
MLQELVDRSPEITGIVLASLDGFPLQYASRNTIDVDRQAAVIASLASLAKRSTQMVDIGAPEEILITSERGRMFIYRIEDLAALGVITAKDITAGMILLKIRQMLPFLVEELRREIETFGGRL